MVSTEKVIFRIRTTHYYDLSLDGFTDLQNVSRVTKINLEKESIDPGNCKSEKDTSAERKILIKNLLDQGWHFFENSDQEIENLGIGDKIGKYVENGVLFKLGVDEKNWEEADVFCRSQTVLLSDSLSHLINNEFQVEIREIPELSFTPTLASVRSSEEFQAIEEFNFNGINKLWLGAKDVSQSTRWGSRAWRWSGNENNNNTDPVTYFNWDAKGNSNRDDTQLDCMALHNENNDGWRMYAQNCTEKKHYACEIRIKELEKMPPISLEQQFIQAECEATLVEFTNNIFCKCTNGFPHANDDCPAENTESCESCFDSYIFDETTGLCMDACQFDPMGKNCIENSRQFVRYSNQQSLSGLTDELYYKLNTDVLKTFDEAKLDCETNGGVLAAISSEIEEEFAKDVIGDKLEGEGIWIGLRLNSTSKVLKADKLYWLENEFLETDLLGPYDNFLSYITPRQQLTLSQPRFSGSFWNDCGDSSSPSNKCIEHSPEKTIDGVDTESNSTYSHSELNLGDYFSSDPNSGCASGCKKLFQVNLPSESHQVIVDKILVFMSINFVEPNPVYELFDSIYDADYYEDYGYDLSNGALEWFYNQVFTDRDNSLYFLPIPPDSYTLFVGDQRCYHTTYYRPTHTGAF